MTFNLLLNKIEYYTVILLIYFQKHYAIWEGSSEVLLIDLLFNLQKYDTDIANFSIKLVENFINLLYTLLEEKLKGICFMLFWKDIV